MGIFIKRKNMHKFSVITDAPAGTKGLVKELRVRWFLEEIGEPYEEMRFKHSELKLESYLKLQPFGQVPAYQNEDLEMYETGAILLFLADETGKLLPKEGKERANALTWLFALLNSLEPFITARIWLNFSFEKNDVINQIMSQNLMLIQDKLSRLEKTMIHADFVTGEFSIVDIVFVTILRNPAVMSILGDHPKLKNYLVKMEDRPAFLKALNDHSKLYKI
jgi:glutathione S-transferase